MYFYFRCDFNKYTLQYLSKLGPLRSKKEKESDDEVDYMDLDVSWSILYVFCKIKLFNFHALVWFYFLFCFNYCFLTFIKADDDDVDEGDYLKKAFPLVV